MLRRAWLPPAVVVTTFGVLYALVARVAWRAYPLSGDEYSGVLQGQIFARGLLRAPAPPNVELLRIDHVVIDHWVRSKYPPGASALLAIGERVGASWLVTPVEGAATLGLVWLAVRMLMGARAALVSVVVLGLSPLFAVEAASFYSHTPLMMWTAAVLAAIAAWTQTRRDVWLVAAGAALGCALLTRPFDAVLLGAALLALQSPGVVLLTALGAAPLLALHLAYQSAVFGSPWTDGYQAYNPTLRAIYGDDAARSMLSLAWLGDPQQQWFHAELYASLVTRWSTVGAVVLAAVGMAAAGKDPRARPVRDVCVALVVAALLGMLPTMMTAGDDGPRPRYLSTTLLAGAYFAGPGWERVKEALGRRLGARAAPTGVATAALLGTAMLLGGVVVNRAREVQARDGLFDATRSAGVTDGVVVVRTQFPTRYARNGGFFDGPVLYVSAPASMDADSVASRYPDRPVYEAFDGSPWSIARRR